MKRYYKMFACWVSVLLLVFSSGMQSHASLESLLISTDSNALMTMELDDSDYAVMPMSSVGTVENTISESQVVISCFDGVHIYNRILEPELVDGRFQFHFIMPDGFENYWVHTVGFYIKDKSTGIDGMPSADTYNMSFDFTSHIGYTEPSNVELYSKFIPDNAESIDSAYFIHDYSFSSGDLYIPPFLVNVRNNVQILRITELFYDSHDLKQFGGSYAINFTLSNESGGVNLAGSNSTINDYENDVSSSLSDLSLSVGDLSEDMSSAAESLEYISTSQNLIIQGIDNVILHISDQLYAFWDQLYNLIHVPTMAKLDDIISAINNLDLEIEVNLDELKTSIDTMSTAVQNKLQATTDQITGGFDNSQQTQQNQQLQDSINAYDEVEEDIFEDVDGFMQEFEYPSFDSMNGSVIKALAFIGGFLQSIFLSMDDFGTIITFSLTMIFVMIIVGYHRIRS